jgi:hypothetical protein
VVIAAFAVAGNALRAAAPRTVADIELRRVSTPQAGSFTERRSTRDFLELLRARDVLYRIYTQRARESRVGFLATSTGRRKAPRCTSPPLLSGLGLEHRI